MAIPATQMQKEPTRALAPSAFLKELSAELASGDVRLPSFPDIAQRVQRALEDPRATPAQVARVIGIDAALAVRILRLANSAFLNPSAKPITELQQAVKRLGHQLVRCTAVSFALQQMNAGEAVAVLRPQLHELWRKGTLVASIAYVLARETRAANPDEALVAGLMYNIGNLYITVRAHQHGAALGDDAATRVLSNGHPRIAAAILGHWKFAPSIVSAVGNQNATDLPTATGSGPLTDVLIAAISLVPCVFYRGLLDETVTSVGAFQRLALDAAACKRLLSTAARQIKSLHSALVG
jgi:HD-like signal output (HDOD) protein